MSIHTPQQEEGKKSETTMSEKQERLEAGLAAIFDENWRERPDTPALVRLLFQQIDAAHNKALVERVKTEKSEWEKLRDNPNADEAEVYEAEVKIAALDEIITLLEE